MRLLLILVISLISFTTSFAQLDSQNCDCATTTSETIKWGKTSRGNEYCTYTTRSGKVAKEYKKYFGSEAPTALTATDLAMGKIWVQVKRGRNVGKWYKKAAKVTSK